MLLNCLLDQSVTALVLAIAVVAVVVAQFGDCKSLRNT